MFEKHKYSNMYFYSMCLLVNQIDKKAVKTNVSGISYRDGKELNSRLSLTFNDETAKWLANSLGTKPIKTESKVVLLSIEEQNIYSRCWVHLDDDYEPCEW